MPYEIRSVIEEDLSSMLRIRKSQKRWLGHPPDAPFKEAIHHGTSWWRLGRIAVPARGAMVDVSTVEIEIRTGTNVMSVRPVAYDGEHGA